MVDAQWSGWDTEGRKHNLPNERSILQGKQEKKLSGVEPGQQVLEGESPLWSTQRVVLQSVPLPSWPTTRTGCACLKIMCRRKERERERRRKGVGHCAPRGREGIQSQDPSLCFTLGDQKEGWAFAVKVPLSFLLLFFCTSS